MLIFKPGTKVLIVVGDGGVKCDAGGEFNDRLQTVGWGGGGAYDIQGRSKTKCDGCNAAWSGGGGGASGIW